jgi:hypothetical protein
VAPALLHNLQVPDSVYALDQVRPSLVLLMVLGKSLIMWEGISATQVGAVFRWVYVTNHVTFTWLYRISRMYVLLMVLGKSLIMWEGISATQVGAVGYWLGCKPLNISTGCGADVRWARQGVISRCEMPV